MTTAIIEETGATSTAKYKKFLDRTGFDEKPYQVECFGWCLAREQTQAQQTQAQQTQAQQTQAQQAQAQ